MKRESSRRLRPAIGVGLTALIALTLPAAASADALYDQTTGTAGGLVTLPQSGLFISPLADDFTVPPGPGWLFENAHIEGQGVAGEQFGVAILQDSGGLPSSGGADVLFGYGPKLGSSGSFDVPAPKKYKYVTDLPYGIGLLPGHYWLELLELTKPGQSQTSGAWRTQSPQSGSEAATYDAANSNWRHLSDAGQSGPDFQFRVDGEPISSDASRFKLSKPVRRPGGAVLVLANFPGDGTPKLKFTSGKKWVKPLKLHSNVYGTHLKFNPTAKAKRKFRRDGKHLKFSATVTYARSFGGMDSPQPFVAPPTTQTIHSVFKKPKPQGQ